MKKRKLDKDTRRYMEAYSEKMRKKKSGVYVPRGDKKKKTMAKVKRCCMHHWAGKDNVTPSVKPCKDEPNMWECDICHVRFPIDPPKTMNPDKYSNGYAEAADHMIQLIDQLKFWSVELGGDIDDVKYFTILTRDLRELNKRAKPILKRVYQHEHHHSDKQKSSTDQFSVYSAIGYR